MDNILGHWGIILLIAVCAVKFAKMAAKFAGMAKKASENDAAPSIETAERAYGENVGKEAHMPKVERRVAAAPTPAKRQMRVKKSSGMEAEADTAGHIANEKTGGKIIGIEKSDSPAAVSVSCDDFDLRKAVIYSEVLTPKFKEE